MCYATLESTSTSVIFIHFTYNHDRGFSHDNYQTLVESGESLYENEYSVHKYKLKPTLRRAALTIPGYCNTQVRTQLVQVYVATGKIFP